MLSAFIMKKEVTKHDPEKRHLKKFEIIVA